jgi:hypothetical protein
MGHLHQLRHRHLGKRQADEGAEADVLAARQLGAPLPGSATTNTDDSSGGTVLSIIYVTASPTFTGAIGGYTTLDVGAPVQQTPATSKHQKSSQESSTSSLDDTFATISAATSSSTSTTISTSSSSSTFATMTSAIVTSATSLVTSVSQSKSSPTIAGGAVAEATASSTAQASPSTVQTGMSTGAKTALAIGILLAVAIVAAGVLFLYWKKKKAVEEDEKPHSEKAAFGADAAPMAGSLLSSAPPTTTKIGSSAPMLDLRPMSRLMPELMGQRRSQGNLLNTPNAPTAAAAAGASRSLTPPREGSPWERRANTTDENVENPFSDPTNPFGDEQAKAVSPSGGGPAVPAPSPSMPAPLNVRSVAPVAAAGAAVAGAAVTAVAAAKPTESPAVSHTSAMPQGAAGAVAGPGAPPNNVHAVQLDFKPSMEDEIELRSGQLVRILHEYDDGWVSRFFPKRVNIANKRYRPCAFASTALNKV